MKIFIPGGEGYIGRVITNHLLKNSCDVKSYDAMLYKQSVDLLNKNNKNYEFICGDINNQQLLEKSMANSDAVVLLAGLVGDPITKKYPKESEKINDIGVKLVIDTCVKLKIKRLIFVSTCSNYGLIPSDKIANEEYKLNPLSSYAKSKVKIEKYILSLEGKSDIKPTILRFATAFGISPRMRFDLTVNEFTRDIFFRKDLLVYDSDTWRPYCHVDDFANLILKVLNAEEKKISFKTFNAGGKENNYTKRMITEEILKLIPVGKVNYQENKVGADPRNYRVDFSKIQNTLNFKITRSVSDGILELIDIFKKKNIFNIEKNKDLFGNYRIEY